MNQADKQSASRNIKEKIAEMEKLLKKLATWLNVPGQKEKKLFEIFGTFAEPAAMTPIKDK